MTTNYKTLWKTLANEKRIESYHVVQYCLIKSIKAKGENKEEILNALLKKAFSPKNNGTYPGLTDAAGWTRTRRGLTLFNQVLVKDFLTEEELKIYTRLRDGISPKELVDTNQYSYIFVRQDLKPEYQLVQAAHVTCVLGSKIKIDPSKLYFVVVGVSNLEALDEVLEYYGKKGHQFVDFIEPDIGDERTAVATLPIRGDMRKDFKKLKLLKF